MPVKLSKFILTFSLPTTVGSITKDWPNSLYDKFRFTFFLKKLPIEKEETLPRTRYMCFLQRVAVTSVLWLYYRGAI